MISSEKSMAIEAELLEHILPRLQELTSEPLADDYDLALAQSEFLMMDHLIDRSLKLNMPWPRQFLELLEECRPRLGDTTGRKLDLLIRLSTD